MKCTTKTIECKYWKWTGVLQPIPDPAKLEGNATAIINPDNPPVTKNEKGKYWVATREGGVDLSGGEFIVQLPDGSLEVYSPNEFYQRYVIS